VGRPRADVGVSIRSLFDTPPFSGTVAPGREVTLDIIVVNDGPDAAEPVTLTDVVPAGTSFVSFTGAPSWRRLALRGPRRGIGSVIATTEVMTPGISAEFLLTVRVNAAERPGTVIIDTAKVATTARDPNPKNNVFSRGFLVG
jgi:uncharacterized repeat protein (TIGR01451 family)